ncbi:MAG TPA: hypothetical protein DCY35_04215 [Prolixibacteraceae bacterium]|nr:hypothetical protein [Prolixibacteraceae bacterium]
MQGASRLEGVLWLGFGIMVKWTAITITLTLAIWLIPMMGSGSQNSPSNNPRACWPNTINSTSDVYGKVAFTSFLDFPTEVIQPNPLRRKRNFRKEKALLVGFNLLGATMNYGSAYLGYALGRVVNLETGLDLTTAYGGVSLHPIQFRRVEGLSPYMGLMAGYAGIGDGPLEEEFYMYMPVGVRYLTPDNWHISIEIAATTADNIHTGPLYGGIKLGYYFKL